MRHSAIALSATVAVLSMLASGCATHQTAKDDAASILAEGPSSETTRQPGMAGRTSMAWGDAWTAARLFKNAVAANPTAINRFNLATAYQGTGRLQDAAALYGPLLIDGRYIWVNANRDINNLELPGRRFNIAEESAHRLADIARTVGSAAAAAKLAESNVGGPASTEVGGPARGAVTDDRARQLDVAAEVVRAP